MKSQNKVTFPVGLEESQIIDYSFSGNELKITLRLWNEKKLYISFREVALFFVIEHFEIQCMFDNCKGDFLDRALLRVYENVPEKHDYTLIQFHDIEDEPVVEIVSTGFKFTIE